MTDRRTMLAKIHIAKKDVGMTNDQYRNLLQDSFGVDSAARMDHDALQRLLDHFVRLGFKPKARAKKATRTKGKKHGHLTDVSRPRSSMTDKQAQMMKQCFKRCYISNPQWFVDNVLKSKTAPVADLSVSQARTVIKVLMERRRRNANTTIASAGHTITEDMRTMNVWDLETLAERLDHEYRKRHGFK